MQEVLLAAELGPVGWLLGAVDASKIHAAASKHQAMSSQRMQEVVPKLQAEIAALVAAHGAVGRVAPSMPTWRWGRPRIPRPTGFRKRVFPGPVMKGGMPDGDDGEMPLLILGILRVRFTAPTISCGWTLRPRRPPGSSRPSAPAPVPGMASGCGPRTPGGPRRCPWWSTRIGGRRPHSASVNSKLHFPKTPTHISPNQQQGNLGNDRWRSGQRPPGSRQAPVPGGAGARSRVTGRPGARPRAGVGRGSERARGPRQQHRSGSLVVSEKGSRDPVVFGPIAKRDGDWRMGGPIPFLAFGPGTLTAAAHDAPAGDGAPAAAGGPPQGPARAYPSRSRCRAANEGVAVADGSR